jgi:hypothetical protein
MPGEDLKGFIAGWFAGELFSGYILLTVSHCSILYIAIYYDYYNSVILCLNRPVWL